MKKKLFQLTEYLRYRWAAKNLHGVHSPFVYEFNRTVLPHRPTETGERIERLRQKCAADKQTCLTIRDFGAGYDGIALPNIEKTLSEVARGSARRRRIGELLGRICGFVKPKIAVEFGANLGFSTLYQLAALQVTPYRFISVEADPTLSGYARRHCEQFGFPVEILTKTFDDSLDELTALPLDYVFLDGHHTYEATTRYAKRLLPAMQNGSLMILDDIHWSKGMRRAWDEIRALPEASVTIDLYFIGLIFFHRPQVKEHFVLLHP